MASKKGLTDAQCRKIAMAAVHLLGDCADERQTMAEEDCCPEDAEVTIDGNGINVCHVEMVLEGLGLKHAGKQ